MAVMVRNVVDHPDIRDLVPADDTALLAAQLVQNAADFLDKTSGRMDRNKHVRASRKSLTTALAGTAATDPEGRSISRGAARLLHITPTALRLARKAGEKFTYDNAYALAYGSGIRGSFATDKALMEFATDFCQVLDHN